MNAFNMDLHLHSRFSPDSAETMERHCERALELGLCALCFTDHQDFDDASLGYYDAAAYFETLERMRERYAGRLTLWAGLEFSEPHNHPRELEEAQRRPYDFILGSVHYWMKGAFASEMVQRGDDLRVCFEAYWEEVRRMAHCGGFDCAAHLDFPKRYFKMLFYEPERLDEIFSLLRKKGILLEINSSSLRRGCDEAMPGEALLRQYAAGGGKYVTLGSDAHCAGDLYKDVPQIREQALALGLKPVHFVRRRLVAGA
ncbi:MAG: histidinol-phosphatase HisJ family protein [Oscillospiraceae bacterium]|jgi:histidinol-phosphatase (PHP family)|nr:histidinol-phosphatase HisJ family protein [Oscillospiraceae bacterium]